jgi:hypothetical protein
MDNNFNEQEFQERVENMMGGVFPNQLKHEGITINYRGISKRELYAAMALQGMLASGLKVTGGEFASQAVSLADCLIEELDKDEE